VTFLALDVGWRSVAAAVWSSSGLESLGRSDSEPSPRSWWAGVEGAVGALSADLVAVEAIGCSAASDLWLLLARDGEPLSVLPAGSPVESLRSASLDRAGWLANARDFVASLLTGRLASDPTVASASGFFTPGGDLDAAAVAAAGIDPEWLPKQQGSTDVLGDLLLPAARRLGLRSRLPVVMGATTETCAVEGAGALPVAPLVTVLSSGGDFVQVPVEPPVAVVPDGVVLRAGGRSYQVLSAVAPDAEEVARLVSLLAPEARFLYAGGDGDRAWRAALTAATALPLAHRRSAEHASLGLAMLTATGAGAHLDRDAANPVASVDEPFAALA
jgi:sugar (pentulose or hexulose) kinase